MFTTDWFEKTGQRNFEKNLIHLAGVKRLKFLEVGCYEGAATVWMLKHVLTDNESTIDVIDTFEGSIEHQEKREELKIDSLKDRFLENISEHRKQVSVHIGYSQEILKALKQQFDFIYIDGSHQAADVIEDAILAFKLLKSNGIMGFDDYKWNGIGDRLRHPQIAIDAFVTIFADKLKTVEKNYQLFIRKI